MEQILPNQLQDQPNNQSKDQPKRYQCRHIFTDGHRCGSASLRNEDFCYYHHTTRPPAASPRSRKARRGAFALPLPEDRSAIQASIGQVLLRIASNDIDPRRAGLLLYGLQIAVRNLPKEQHIQPEDEKPHQAIVEQIEIHPELGPLAPQAEAPHPRRLTRQYILEGKIRDVEAKERKLYEREYALSENEREFRIRKMKEEAQSARTLQPPPPQPLTIPNSHPGTAILPDVKAVAEFVVIPEENEENLPKPDLFVIPEGNPRLASAPFCCHSRRESAFSFGSYQTTVSGKMP